MRSDSSFLVVILEQAQQIPVDILMLVFSKSIEWLN